MEVRVHICGIGSLLQSLFTWVPRIKLRAGSRKSRCLFLLSHLARPRSPLQCLQIYPKQWGCWIKGSSSFKVLAFPCHFPWPTIILTSSAASHLLAVFCCVIIALLIGSGKAVASAAASSSSLPPSPSTPFPSSPPPHPHRVSMCSSNWPQIWDPLAFTSQVLGLKVQATTLTHLCIQLLAIGVSPLEKCLLLNWTIISFCCCCYCIMEVPYMFWKLTSDLRHK